MATEEKTYGEASYEDFDDHLKEIFDKASVEDIMETVMLGFIAIAHKAGVPVSQVIASCYLSYQAATNIEQLTEAFGEFDKYRESQGLPKSGMGTLLSGVVPLATDRTLDD